MRIYGLLPICAAILGAQTPGCMDYGVRQKLTNGDLEFEYPAGWQVVEKAESGALVRPPGRATCDVVVSLNPVEPGTDLASISQRIVQEARQNGGDAQVMAIKYGITLGGVPATKLTVAMTIQRTNITKLMWLAPMGDRTLWIIATAVPHEFGLTQPVFDRIASSVRVAQRPVRSGLSPAYVPPQTGGGAASSVQSSGMYSNGQFSFSYPRDWMVISDGQDPSFSDFRLVKLISRDRSQGASVRYRRSAYRDGYDATQAQKITGIAQSEYGNFHPSPDYPTESWPAGQSMTEVYSKGMGSEIGTSKQFWATTIWSRGNLAHVAFVLDRAVNPSTASRELILRSLRFAVDSGGSASTLVGKWTSQGADLYLNADGSFNESIWTINTENKGTYQISGNRITFRYSRRGYRQTNEVNECSYRVGSGELSINCGGNVVNWH